MKQETISRQLPGQPRRTFVVTYLDDVSERAEALVALRRVKCDFFPADPFPKEIDSMGLEEAQRFLDQHPVPRLWDLIGAFGREGISDSDLENIRFFPELKIVRIISDQLTDRGVAHLTALHSIEVLHLYGRGLTDASLKDISTLKSLRSLDFQGAPGVSPSAFDATVRRLPQIKDIYPPRCDSPDKKRANQALLPTSTSITIPAAQDSRRL